ncbi:hypothetical protein MiSe_90110 [Microseira wollei NIES-4236]|uniref:Asparagine synthetase domain-containing protein n=2 Tax=Microseira wollei TaxID=467598 RepID=A0AAV3XTQ1_9CYAN|nr:hypothetical protein MiSe_90110 [Microseira wollei NIES-4236]
MGLVAIKLREHVNYFVPFSDEPGENLSIICIHSMARYCSGMQQVAQASGVNLTFPFFDSLLIDTCLKTKVEDRTSPFVYKPLLKEALYCDFPGSFLSRSTKGDYTTQRCNDILVNLSKIHDRFDNSYLFQMGLIDIKKFRICLDQLAAGYTATLRSLLNNSSC